MLQFRHFPQHVQALIDAALAAAAPDAAVRRMVTREDNRLCIGAHEFDLSAGRLLLVSTGKAAVPMALAAAEQLGPALAQGVVISKVAATEEQQAAANNIKFYAGGHPLPTAASVSATEQVLNLLGETQVGDVVIFLISGGTSALLTHPNISLDDWQRLTDALLGSGCTINELNRVRRQLDPVKGGGLARMAAPAKCISLILSDVVGNPLADIGSGPTVSVEETAEDALEVLRRYNVAGSLEPDVWHRVREALQPGFTTDAPGAPAAEESEAAAESIADAEATAESGADTDLPADAEATGDVASEGLTAVESMHMIIGDVRRSALAAMTKAMQMGFVSQLLTARLEGEAREVARVVAALAKDAPRERCLILGGETTVTLHGNGTGGRNQELALSAALALADWPGVVVASFATDGEDGSTSAAGAVITGGTVTAAQAYELDPQSHLDRNDSYTFFKALDEQNPEGPATLLQTGPTGTNVNDLVFVLTYPQPNQGFQPPHPSESEEEGETVE